LPLVFDITEDRPIETPSAEVRVVVEDAVELIDSRVPLGVWRTVYQTGHVYFSPEVFRIYGLEPSEVPVNLLEINERIHPEDLKVCLGLFEEAAREKNGFQYSLRIEDGKGGYKYVRSVGRYRETVDGFGEMVGIFHEIREEP